MNQTIYERYTETIFNDVHANLDFDQVAQGFEEFYHDCLPMDRDAPILDVGCGMGHFLHFLELKNYRKAEGIELSEQQAAKARTHVQALVHTGDVGVFLRDRRDHFAAITMNDVLEHIPKHETVPFLETLKRGLRKEGALVVNVPRVNGLATAYSRYHDFTHELVFTEPSLRQVLLMAGFREVRFVQEYWPLKWTPRHLCFRLARWAWYRVLHLIYFLEMPGGNIPKNWGTRLVAVARP